MGSRKDSIEYPGLVFPLAVDTCSDIALVQLPTLPQGWNFEQVFDLNSNDDVRAGQSIFTFGHPYGANYAMRFAHISCPNRPADEAAFRGLNPNLAPKEDFCHIEGDYLTPPAFSGGPCVNSQGNVIGLNSHITYGDYNHMSYSVPTRFVRHLVNWHQANLDVGRSQIFFRGDGDPSPFWMRDIAYGEDANRYMSETDIIFWRKMFSKSKDMRRKILTRRSKQVNVKVLNGKATYVAAFLHADFSLNIGFIKIMSPIQHEVARFGKLSSMFLGREAVAVGCTSRGRGLPDADFHYHPGFFGPIGKEIKNKQSDASASGPVIYAHVEGYGTRS